MILNQWSLNLSEWLRIFSDDKIHSSHSVQYLDCDVAGGGVLAVCFVCVILGHLVLGLVEIL